jgi:hypothetical protein
MAEQIYDVFDRWREHHAWIEDRNIAPKGVVADMWDRAMDFGDFVRHYGLKRSEGRLLRYLSDCFRTMERTVPDDAKDEGVEDLLDWLDAVIRATEPRRRMDGAARPRGGRRTGRGARHPRARRGGRDPRHHGGPPGVPDARAHPGVPVGAVGRHA